MKFSTWLTLTAIAGLAFSAIAPAIAQDSNTPSTTPTTTEPTTAPATTEPTTTDTTTQSIKGTIKSIVGPVVTLQLEDGRTTSVTLGKDQLGKYSLRPGMYLVTDRVNGITVIRSASYAARSSDSSTSSRILNIKAPQVSSETSTETTGSTTVTETTTPAPAPVESRTTTTVETTPAAPEPTYAPEPLPATPRALW